LPLHTIRANIDYGFAEANTTTGDRRHRSGIYKGECSKCRSPSLGADLPGRERKCHVDAEKGQISKTAEGQTPGKAWRGSEVTFGDYGLKALESAGSRPTDRSGARAITRFIKRGGKIWIRVSPTSRSRKSRQKPAWKRARSSRRLVAVVRPGKIVYEMEGVAESVAQEALRLAAHKISVKAKFVKRFGMEEA